MIPRKSAFIYYYDIASKVIEDFKRYKDDTNTNSVQTSKHQIENASAVVNNIKQVWRDLISIWVFFPIFPLQI